MINLKKALSVLTVSAMLILPVSLPVQATEMNHNTNNEATTTASTYSFTGYGQINANGVHLRAGAGTNTTSLGLMSYNETVHIDYSKSVSSNGTYTWLFVKRSNTGQTGYVSAQYVRRYA